MNAPPVEDGAVLIDCGKVVAAGKSSEIETGSGDFIVEDYGDAVVLPGLVNPHVHLELSHVMPPAQGMSFTEWLLHVMSSAGPTDPIGASKEGVRQCLRFGVTTVGDISRNCAEVRRVLAASPLRAVSYGEVVGMARRRHVTGSRLAAALDLAPTPRLGPGVSPHAPYSIDADGYRRCIATATTNGVPLATHLAESPDEAQFLADHTGPFRELWERLDAWDDSVPPFKGGPIRYAEHLGLLRELCVLAHVNYCDDEELNLLAAGDGVVVYCPRTHAYFRHPPHRWRDMLDAGIEVAVGTDSCASSGDLNVVDDLRSMHRLAPDVPALTLWAMVTLTAAYALGVPAGEILQGGSADVVVFPAARKDPLKDVLETSVLPLAVWVEGRPIDSTVMGPAR